MSFCCFFVISGKKNLTARDKNEASSNSQQSILLFSDSHIFVHSLMKYHKKISMPIIDSKDCLGVFLFMDSLKCVYRVYIVPKHEFREEMECFFAWNVLP